MSRFIRRPKQQRGFTIVEILVASLIGLLSIYAVYIVFNQVDRTNRTTTSVSNLQVSGWQSINMLEQNISDAGSGMMYKEIFDAMIKCSGFEDFIISPGLGGGALISMRPTPVIIKKDANGPGLDAITVFAGAPTVMFGVLRGFTPELGPSVKTASTSMLPLPLKVNDVLVGIDAKSPDGFCAAYFVTKVDKAAKTVDLLGGFGTAHSGSPSGDYTPTTVINLGRAERIHYAVDTASRNVLTMERFTADDKGRWTSTTQPMLGNVVLLVAWYGLDTDNDNKIDTWQDAQGTWAFDNVGGATTSNITGEDIKTIKAVRVGLVAAYDDPGQIDEAAGYLSGSSVKLFTDCVGTCPALPEFVFANYPAPEGTFYRFRKYETIIPLRNSVWNNNKAAL